MINLPCFISPLFQYTRLIGQICKDNFYFSSEVTGSEECFFEPGNEIDLDPHILALILAEVPHNIVKKGAKRPSSGEGYRVLSEEEFEAAKKKLLGL